MRLSLYNCFYFVFFLGGWFAEVGAAVSKIVSFSADFRYFFIGMGYRVC